MGSALLSPFGVGIAGAAAFGLVKHLVDVGSAAEDSKLSLTALIQQASRDSNLPFAGFDRASMAATALRDKFRELAVDSPVSAKAIRTSFESTAFFLSKAGLSLEQQSVLARNIALVDKQLGKKGTTGRDVAQILAGRGGVSVIQSPLLKGIAKEAAALAKSGDVAGAAKLIQEKLTPDPALLKAYGNSFGGLVSNMSEQLLVLKEEASKPVMEFISEKLREWVMFLKENKELAKEFAKTFGRAVVSALKAVVRLVKFIAKNWETIVDTVQTLAAVWIGAKLVAALTTVIGLAVTFDKTLAAAGVTAGKLGSRLRAAGALGAAAAAGAAAGAGVNVVVNAIADATRPSVELLKSLPKLRKKFISEKGRAPGAAELVTFAVRERIAGRALLVEANRRTRVGLAAAADRKAITSVLEQEFDPLRGPRRGGGGGRRVKKMRVQTMLVDKLRPRDRDFARLSTPATTGIGRESFARRPLAAAGLAIASTGI